MQITDVRVALSATPTTRLKAYASVTFDHCFVVRNVKIIEGKHGVFVAMPSRKPKVTCATCHMKSDLGNRFCPHCGAALLRPSATPGAGDLETPEVAAHRDIVHPVTTEFRQYLQKTVLEAYDAEQARGGSVSRSHAAEGDSEHEL